MAGRNPTAWTGPLRLRGSPARQFPEERHGLGMEERVPGLAQRAWVEASTQGVTVGRHPEHFLHSRAQSDSVSHDFRGPEQRAVQAFVIGADPESPPDGPFRLLALPAP